MNLKNISLLLLLGACIFFTACHNDNEEISEPQTILTLNVDAAYSGKIDTWIFATDESGKLLDLKHYDKGETVTLSTLKKADKFNVTFFDVVQNYPNNQSFFFITYADISKGTVLNLLPTSDDTHTDGTASFRLVNFSERDNLFGTLRFSGLYSYRSTDSQTGGVFDADVNFRGNPADILMTSYRSGVPVYNWAKGVKSGDFIQRDFNNDFDPFPNLIKLDFEGKNSGTIYGTDADGSNAYMLCDSYFLDQTQSATNTPTLGYLDGFKNYWMAVTNEKANGSVTYYKEGKPGSSFAIPTFTFSLANEDIRDFSFNFSEDYTYYEASWRYSRYRSTDYSDYTWLVYAPANQAVKVLSIPLEIATKYPDIKFNNFKYSHCSPVQVIKGRQYHDIVRGMPARAWGSEIYFFSPKI